MKGDNPLSVRGASGCVSPFSDPFQAGRSSASEGRGKGFVEAEVGGRFMTDFLFGRLAWLKVLVVQLISGNVMVCREGIKYFEVV